MKTKLGTIWKWAPAFALAILLGACEQKVQVTPDQVTNEFAKAKSSFDELIKYNPPETMTYNYRNLMSQAEDAKAKGNFEQATALAKKAEEQAFLSIQLIKDTLGKDAEKLANAKDQIEAMFPVNRNLVGKYWQLLGRLNNNDFSTLDADVNGLLKSIDQEKKLTMITDRYLVVSAPQEYIKQWGNVRIYKEITADGKLKDVVDSVTPGGRVKVLKVKLFSPDTIFYFVETGSSSQGWMAEKYLSEENKF
jgi:hypothetical protein